MKYVIIDNSPDVITISSKKDHLMFENCAQVEYEFNSNDVKLNINDYYYDEKALAEFIAFLTAAREYLIANQK